MPIKELEWVAQLGIAGVAVVCLFYLLWSQGREHRLERREWREAAEKDRDITRDESKLRSDALVKALDELKDAIRHQAH